MIVEGKIPDKYKASVDVVVDQLKNAGFDMKEIGYGHLFFFLFAWLDKFIPLSRSRTVEVFYRKIMNFEQKLLTYPVLKKRAAVFNILCIK